MLLKMKIAWDNTGKCLTLVSLVIRGSLLFECRMNYIPHATKQWEIIYFSLSCLKEENYQKVSQYRYIDTMPQSERSISHVKCTKANFKWHQLPVTCRGSGMHFQSCSVQKTPNDRNESNVKISSKITYFVFFFCF